jgi:NAD(P)-dependent dehydrogenase (short-subunit alcohol dehydrogenase family)
MVENGQPFEGKVAVVTGASRGIGRVIALSLAREGADLVITGRALAALEEVAAEVHALGQACRVIEADMTDEAQVRGIAEQALGWHERIDLLVNNAATIQPRINLIDFDFAEWRRILEVNLISVVALSQAVLPTMIAASGGKIINISSIGGKHPSQGQTAYKASKAGVINFTACLAAEVKEFGIDVNCVCPGGTDTDGFRTLFGAPEKTGMAPMDAQAIADVVMFLASGASRALTGAAIDAFGRSSPIFR